MKIAYFIKFVIYCILIPTEYYLVNDELYVREWFNKPKELYKHLKEDHHLNEAEINDIMLEARNILKSENKKGSDLMAITASEVYIDETGGLHYHTSGCPILSGKFQYNYILVKLEYALKYEYKPCPFCHKGKMLTRTDLIKFR